MDGFMLELVTLMTTHPLIRSSFSFRYYFFRRRGIRRDCARSSELTRSVTIAAMYILYGGST